MADKSVSIDLVIKSSEAASSLKEVKQSLKDIKDAMIGAGEGSAEFNKLAQAAAQLKDKVDDSNEAIAAMNPNKFQAVASFAASAAGGISAVTGAMGLFGEQSEEVTKTLAKVQSAMALSQGLAALSELPKAWNALKSAMASTAIVQNIVTAATKLWNLALAANPIGLIIAGVVALAAAVYGLTKAFGDSNKEQERQLKLAKDLNAASVEGAKNAAVERNNLDNLYKASTDQTKSIKERKEAQIELQKTYPLTFKNFSDEDFALGKAKIGFDNLSESVLSLAIMKAKQSTLDKMAIEKEEFMVTKTAELTQAISDQTNARTTWGKVAGYTREENIREEIAAKEIEFNLNSKAIISEIDVANKKSKLAEEEKVASKIAEKDKTDADAKAKENAEKNAAAYKASLEEKARLDEAALAFKKSTDEKFRQLNLTDEQKSLEKFKAQQLIYLQNENISKIEYANSIKAFEDEQRKEKLLKGVQDVTDNTQMYVDESQNIIRIAKETADEKIRIEKEKVAEEKAIRKKEFTDKLELALKLNQGLQSLSDMAFTIKMHNTKKGSAEEEKALRAQFKINKALQLSSVIIEGILGAQIAYAAGVKAGSLTTGGLASLPMGAIYAGVSIAGTLAAVAKIAATQFDTTSVGSLNTGGGGGGGGGGPTPDLNAGAATATSNSQPSTLLNPDGTVANNNNTPTPTPIQVYVVESDITSTQQRVNVVQNQMSFQ